MTVAINQRVAGVGAQFATDDAGNVAGLVGPDGATVSIGARTFPNTAVLPKWHLALAKVRRNLGRARILVVGDSTVAGSGSTGTAGYTNARVASFPVQLASLLSSNGVPVRADAIIGTQLQANYPVYDPRVSYTAGWTSAVALNNAIGGAFKSQTNGDVLSFTPTTPWDSAEVWYPQSGTQGNFKLGVDGGAGITFITGNGASAIKRASMVTTLGAHTLNITKTNATANYILGIRTWDSTKNQVEIFQAGWPGGKAVDIAVSANPWDGLNEIYYASSPNDSIKPDLTIIDLAINDWNAGTTIGDAGTPGTYLYQIQQIITAAKNTGDCIIVSGVPSAVASYAALATQQTYVDALSTLAAANGCVFVDTWRRTVSYEAATVFYTDTLHPNGAGYAEMAQACLNALLV